MSESTEPSGLFTSLRRAGNTLIDLVGNRAELFVVELQEERLRLLLVLTLLLLTLLFAGFALALVTAAFVYLLWSTHPLLALLGTAALYTAAAVLAWTRMRARLHEQEPFSATLEEFKKDRQCFRPKTSPPSDSASSSSSSKPS